MRRWAIHLFCLFSLLVFAAGVAIWLRSYVMPEAIRWSSAGTKSAIRAGALHYVGYQFGWGRGSFSLAWNSEERETIPIDKPGWVYIKLKDSLGGRLPLSRDERMNRQIAGWQFVYGFHSDAYGWMCWQFLVVPLWVFLPFAIPPILWLRRRRRSGGRGFSVSSAASLTAEGTKTATTE